jgi:hypothetical protein
MAMTSDTYGHLFPDPEGDLQRMAAAEQALLQRILGGGAQLT